MTNWDEILMDEDEDELVPLGTYPMRVKDATGKIASSDAEMIELVMAIEGGPYDDQWIWTNLVYPTVDSKPGHRRMFFRKLRAFDITQEWIATHRPSKEQMAELLKGRTALGKVVHRKWQGEDRADIEMFTSTSTASGTPEAPTMKTTAPEEPPPVPDLSEVGDPATPTPPPAPTAPPAPTTSGEEPPPPF